MTTRGGARRLGALALAGVLLAACGDGSGAGADQRSTTGRSGAGAEVDWPSSTEPLDPSGLVWALDGVVHLGDGTEVDTGRDTSQFVVAGDGVLTGADGLHHTDRDGTDTDLGIEVGALAASPDGRLVAVLDMVSGPRDDFGTPLAEVVVADLVTGEELLRTSEGMGETSDDLAALYPEIDLGLRFADDTTLAVSGAVGDHDLDVATGATSPAEDAVDDVEVSPDGAWRIESPGGLRDVVVAADGTRVVPDTGSPRWNLEWWADADTVVGYAITGGGTGERVDDDASIVLVGCEVPSGACTRHEETAGADGLSFPAGSRSVPPYSLRPGYVED